ARSAVSSRRPHLLSRKSDRLTSPSIEVRHVDRLSADLENPVATLDDIAFTPVKNVSSVAQNRDLSWPLGRFQQADELQRDRRQWRRRWWADRHRRFGRRGDSWWRRR